MGSTGTDARGFFGALFDLSFTSFITTRIIKVLFVLGIVLAGLWSLFVFAAAVDSGAAGAVLGLLLVPLAFLVFVIYFRVLLEFVAVVFRIAEHTSVMAANSRQPGPGAWDGTATPPPPPPQQGPEPGSRPSEGPEEFPRWDR